MNPNLLLEFETLHPSSRLGVGRGVPLNPNLLLEFETVQPQRTDPWGHRGQAVEP